MYRFFDLLTGAYGPCRLTIDRALRDARASGHGQRGQTRGAIVRTAIGTPDPDTGGQTAMDAVTCEPLWPPHGRSSGAVRWPGPFPMSTRTSAPSTHPRGASAIPHPDDG